VDGSKNCQGKAHNRNKELDNRIKGISTETLKNGGIASLYVKEY